MTLVITTPRNICAVCGEYLPHACAPIVQIRYARFTGRRTVIITDRRNPGEPLPEEPQ